MNDTVLVKIEITRPHGTYWVARATTTDKANDWAETGETPKDAIDKVVHGLTWMDSREGPNV